MRIIATVICLALLPTTGALAQKANQSDDMGEADRLICKSIKKPGSRIAVSRSCHTAEEWAQIRRQTRQTVEKIQSNKTSQGL